jgi:hypothetical protein
VHADRRVDLGGRAGVGLGEGDGGADAAPRAADVDDPLDAGGDGPREGGGQIVDHRRVVEVGVGVDEVREVRRRRAHGRGA